MSQSELACTYAALILHDDGVEVTADKIETILKAAGVTVEPYWPSLFAKVLETKDIGDLITNVGAGAPAAGGAAPAAGGDAAAPAEAAAPAPESEEEEMELDLFG